MEDDIVEEIALESGIIDSIENEFTQDDPSTEDSTDEEVIAGSTISGKLSCGSTL
jgi:hypothetical protein